MSTDSSASLNVPNEISECLWRIFGAGALPMNEESAYGLIERVIAKRTKLPTQQRDFFISEVRGWFQSYADKYWLSEEMHMPVANAILKGIGTDLSKKNAIWAIASMEPEIMCPMIREKWTRQTIELFCTEALPTVRRVSEIENILDPRRARSYVGQNVENAKIPRNAIEKESPLRTFEHLDRFSSELVEFGLRTPVANLVELIVELQPERIRFFIESLEHPVLQTRAVLHFRATALRSDHQAILEWIDSDSSDPLISIAIHRLLCDLDRRYEKSIRLTNHNQQSSARQDSEVRLDECDSYCREVLEGLVDRLTDLPPLKSAMHIGELLSAAPDILGISHEDTKPEVISILQGYCTRKLSSGFLKGLADDVVEELINGLCRSRHQAWYRHLADIAWEMHNHSGQDSNKLAQLAIELHHQKTRSDLNNDTTFSFDWSNWQDRAAIQSLSTAVLLSDSLEFSNCYSEWLRDRCHELPLTIWDVENHYSAFWNADCIAQHWFLVTFSAIRKSIEVGGTVDPVDIRNLVKLTWSHLRFVERHIRRDARKPLVAEEAARTLVDFGEINEAWLINEASDRNLGSLALWALAKQYMDSKLRGSLDGNQRFAQFADEFGRVAAMRFEDEALHDLDSVKYWAKLWWLLKTHEPASRTAEALLIASSGYGKQPRDIAILILKLQALILLVDKLSIEQEHQFSATYRALWGHSTPTDEREHRDEIDTLLLQSGTRFHDLH